jgi:hypothetical protein
MNLQILNGTIDPGWVLTIAIMIVGFLLVRILNRIEKRLEQHDQKLSDHALDIAVLKAKDNGKNK